MLLHNQLKTELATKWDPLQLETRIVWSPKHILQMSTAHVSTKNKVVAFIIDDHTQL